MTGIPMIRACDCSTGIEEDRPMTDAEYAQWQTDQAAAAAAAQAATQRLGFANQATLLHERNRWLAQSDPYVLASPPPDMPADVASAVKSGQAALLAWRQALRDWPTTVTDWTAPPPLPAAPTITLPSGRPLIIVT